mgnify:CR=1 FL=1
MHTIRVDGNDLFAVYAATTAARELIIKEKKPVLIEAISYRVGDHSTSDFSQRYRNEEEMKKWDDLLKKFGNPITRLEGYLKKRNMLTDAHTASLRTEAKNAVRDALKVSTKELLPPIDSLFEDVYHEVPKHLDEQREQLRAHLKKYPNDYHLEKFKDADKWIA